MAPFLQKNRSTWKYFSCAFFMASFSLPSFDTLAQALHYKGVQVKNASISNASIQVLPINDIDLCNGRKDCRWCSNLTDRVTGQVEWVFIGNEIDPSFVLCQRGDSREMKRLINMRYQKNKEPRTQPIVQFWSTQCPREFGEHPTN